ncbi:MAG: PDZ domain-containing protein [bacterium]
MRFTHLLTLASAVGAVTATTSAQEPARATVQSRIRIAAPDVYRVDTYGEPSQRAALGVGTSTTGTMRDTLGLLVTSITRGSPAEKAGLEEGNRIASINGVSLRANAADIEDGEMSNAHTRRLTRELGKAKIGDEVELRVYRDGRSQTIKVKTADSDSLFRRTELTKTTQADRDNHPALGFGIGSTGGRRDTLGVLVMSVSDSSPASKAGLEEGNRIAAINGVNLRVAKEDAGDRSVGDAKAQRLQREVSQLKPGENVTLKVYSEGKFRDVTMKVARAADLPHGHNGMMYIGGDGMGFGRMAPMPPMRPMTPMAPMARMPYAPSMSRIAPMSPMAPMEPMREMRMDFEPEMRRSMEEVRTQLREMRPELESIAPRVRMELDAVRPQLERLQPRIQMELDQVRPQLERLRTRMPEIMDQIRVMPRIRMVNVIV